MGNIESDVCASICGEPEEERDNEVQNEIYIMPDNQRNYNNYNQQHGYNSNNNQYEAPMVSNINAYNNKPTINGPLSTLYTSNNNDNIDVDNTKKSKQKSHGYYDQINNENIQSSYRPNVDIIDQIEKQCDTYCTAMLSKKKQEIINQNGATISYPICKFPAPFNRKDYATKTVKISCCLAERNEIYYLPAIDEYFGDLAEVHKYDQFNEYKLSATPTHSAMNAQQTKSYIHHNIFKPLFDTNISTKKRFNLWASVRLDKLQAFNTNKADIEDLWLTLIAFSGFAAHRTVPFNSDKHADVAFINDVGFLAFYEVRSGYVKYGATAFFDRNYCIKKIYLSHNGRMYASETYSKAEWEHAKWVWKVSVTVATFLIDMVAHCRFREATGLIKAMQSTLNPNHPIRRLLLPFTYGTVYSNRVYNEYLKENGLFHRAFAFTYDALSKLMKEAMSDVPAKRQRNDGVKYRWKFARKKCSAMKICPSQIYTFYSDLYAFWFDTLEFVTNYVFSYYNEAEDDNSLLFADEEMVAFYAALIKNSGIDSKYKLKKINITNMITHFICNSTLWNNHLAGSVSFQYLIDPNFNGLKINGNSSGNDTQSFIEYCCVALSAGWNLMDFKGYNVIFNLHNSEKEAVWEDVLLNDKRFAKNREIFNKYFNITKNAKYTSNRQTIVPNNASNPNYFGCSIML